MIGAWEQLHAVRISSQPELSDDQLLLLALHRATHVVVGGDIEQMRLIAVGFGRPVLTAPQRRAEAYILARGRLVVIVVGRAAGLRVEAFEGVLIDERL